ncbi:MAG: ankyrin repeat domain-containing protein [Bryobacteraceae bacterium]
MAAGILPYQAPLADYEREAEKLVAQQRDRDAAALALIRESHPRYRDTVVPWLVKHVPDEQVASDPFDLADAQWVVAIHHCFRDWAALAEYANAVSVWDSAVYRFESAVEAVVNGDAAGVRAMLAADPQLVHARSTRVTPFDPPTHRSTLLHYLGSNGVEGYRQKTPPNAVEIAAILLQAGADPNSLAWLYGGECTTLRLLVSSSPPADAGLQIPLAKVLIDFGARVDSYGEGKWVSPVRTALVFGFRETAEYLAERGSPVKTIVEAAGLGRLEETRALLGAASELERHQALAVSAQLGRTEVTRFLLEEGEDPSRYNPEGFHAHSTPLHQTALAGDRETTELLVEHGARLDLRDKIYESTPQGWAEWNGKTQVAVYLREKGTSR